MKIKRKLLSAVALLSMFAATGSHAQTSQDVAVSATVPQACVIDGFATPLAVAFGSIDATGGADATAVADLLWRCSDTTVVNFDMSAGGSGSTAARAMTHTNGTDTLSYNLYTDALHTTVWDTGVGNAPSDTGTGLQNQLSTRIYGRVLGTDAEAALPGDYSDIVTISLRL